MPNDAFGGNAKVGQSLVHVPEQAAVRWLAPRVPKCITSVHLVLLSLPISLSIIAFGWLGNHYDIRWLWGMSLMIVLQWLTDSLDGAVGRLRGEGLIRWGYYMDHLLDYVFLAAILIGYMLLLPDQSKWIHFVVLAVFGAFMVNSYLAMAASNKFRIAYLGIGPTEVRILFIILNTLIIVFGTTYMAFALPYVLLFALAGLVVVVARTSRDVMAMDLEAKRLKDAS
jgi:archaetidylinositol phosphate synthase